MNGNNSGEQGGPEGNVEDGSGVGGGGRREGEKGGGGEAGCLVWLIVI